MSMESYVLFRQAIGCILLLDLLLFTPAFGVFFGSRYQGRPRIGSKPVRLVIYITWLASALALALGWHTLVGAVGLFAVCRWTYVDSRWRGFFNGGGAPGHVTCLAVAYVLLFDISLAIDPGARLLQDVGFVLRIHVALVMICAGLYKALTGYLHGEGVEYAVVNPAWGPLHAILRRVSPTSRLWWLINVAGGTVGEISLGVLLLVPHPQVQMLTICLYVVFFALILVQIRVGRLPLIMIALALLFWPTSQPAGSAIVMGTAAYPVLAAVFRFALYTFVVLLGLTKIMQYLNLFLYKALPEPLQTLLTYFMVLVPVLMMRVFMSDFSSFFIRISTVSARTGVETPIVHESTTYSYLDWSNLRLKLRYLHYCESAVLAAIFSGLKSFRQSRDRIDQMILEYAATLPREEGDAIKFQFVAIEKGEREFVYRAVCDFYADIDNGRVTEAPITGVVDHQAMSKFSPQEEFLGFGWHWSIDTKGREGRLPRLQRSFDRRWRAAMDEQQDREAG